MQILKQVNTSVEEVEEESDSGDDLMSLSVHALNGTEAPKTLRVEGNLYGLKPLMLFDSGSSSSFISEHMAAHISGWTPLDKPVQVRIANGAVILCTHQISNAEIYIQGHLFLIDLKILPLRCYDIIIGMDWLAMQVHWQDKRMSFIHQRQTVKIQ